MLVIARTIATIFLVASTVCAWPIHFFPTRNCRGPHSFKLHEAPRTGVCGFFPHNGPVMSYIGGTIDSIERLLLYVDAGTCLDDAAHRIYANYTITNTTRFEKECVIFSNTTTLPTAYTFIEEFLPVANAISGSQADKLKTYLTENDFSGNKLLIQA